MNKFLFKLTMILLLPVTVLGFISILVYGAFIAGILAAKHWTEVV